MEEKVTETFKKRAGCGGIKGTNFENIHIANFVLQLVSNPKIEDFHLSSNDESYEAFDDIVVEAVHQHGKEMYALELKHKDKRTLTLESLQQNKGDFGIVKYFDSFQKCKGATQKFILFTNCKFQVKDNKPFQLEGESFNVTLSKFYPNDVFKISEDTNYCYKFSIVDDASIDSERIRQYKIFFDNFFLYVDQKNVRDLKISTKEKFRKMFLSNKKEFESYLNMISEWSMQEGKKEKLKKNWMQRAIAIHLLSSQTKPLSFVGVNENRKILRQAISNFDITVFTKNTNGKESELWGDAKEGIEDLREVNRIRIKYQLSSTYIDNLDNADPKLLSQLFWILGKCPLIVTEDETVYRAIQLCFKDKFVVLGKGLIKEWQKDFSVFQDLSDLETHSNVYKDVMKNFTCSLQGKEAVSLQIIFTQNQDDLKFVKTDDLLEMLDGPCNVGGKKEDLSKPYIDRFLLRNVIDIRYLEKVDKDTLIILSCENKLEDLKRKLTHHKLIDIDDEEEIKGKSFELGHVSNLRIDFEKSGFCSTIYTSKHDCSLEKFQATCRKNKEVKNCHHFRYRDDGNLDWIRSKNDVSDLENYKVFDEYVKEEFLWSSQPDNNINVIIADPGMGKTEMVKSLKNNSASGFWTILVYPKDIYSFLKNLKNRNNLVEAFEHFILNEKFGSLKELDKEMLKTSIKQNTAIYVWDALDEITSKHLEDVTNMILLLSARNFLQWVTSRQHLKKFLESKFNVLSITVNPFTANEQKFYIKKRLAASTKEESEQIINKILSAFVLVEHKDILGIPLQIFMLTELFRQNKDKYLDLLNSAFALTDLYHYFIEEKTSIYYKERGGLDIQTFVSEEILGTLKRTTLENHEKLALTALFPKEILRRFKINCETELQSIQTNESAIGIITGVTNEIPNFLHASFAEYLVALYFSKNLVLQDILVEIIFQKKYVNVRFFFDLLLAKTSRPHIAVLYKDFDFLKKCDSELMKRKDAGGRSVLHLACSWGQKYPPLNVGKFEDTYLIDNINDFETTAEEEKFLNMIEYLINDRNILENDTLFNMTPSSYALKSDCLFAGLKIMQQQKTQLSSSDSASINILYYSAKFGYSDALDLFIAGNIPFIKTIKYEHCLLHLAVGYKDYMMKLLETNIYKNKTDDKDGNGNTSLHLAAYNGYETAAILIKHGVQIDALNYKKLTPLLLASIKGHDKIVEILIKSRADINFALDVDGTPLAVASIVGHEKIVEILIKSGADINRRTNDGPTPLVLASQQGHEEIVEILIKSGANINLACNTGVTPLAIASQEGHERIAEILIKSGADINLAEKDNCTPLYIASQQGHEEIVEILIKSGADMNLATKDGGTPLLIASFNGHEKIVEILIKSGANINLASNTGVTPLAIASQEGHQRIVEILIKSGADINLRTNDGPTPLFLASQEGHKEIVEILIKSGADINLAQKDNCTPLNIASQEGHDKIVEILIKSGADINLAEKHNCTPLYIASQQGHDKIVEILIKSGADINLSTNTGATPLLIACFKGHVQIVEILIKSGADINSAANDGATPLFIASQKGHVKIVELLTLSGADVNIARNDDTTPLEIASQERHINIVHILTTSGAKAKCKKLL